MQTRTKKSFRAVKYTLFVFCYIFWVFSAVLIAVGIYAKVAKESDAVDTLMADPALLLIIVGTLMFTITFFGCFGALRNISLLLNMFVGILFVILLLQITAAVLGLLFSEKVQERTEQLMMKAIVRYRDDQDLENVIDFVQKKFKCCGVDSYLDWSKNIYFNASDQNPSLEAYGVPFSCCIRLKNETVFNSMCGYESQKLKKSVVSRLIYTTGCLEEIVWWGKQNLLLVGGMTLVLLCIEICMMSLASVQLRQIRRVNEKKKKHNRSENLCCNRKS
ncbi:tetraspanin-33 isoform X1 [Puntigrus tetrazona]|uniref:tetraspanin-33 isoform X1 n=1 Tax=Puntigrus tetrazona TaxID=1606681 RepID=UPI001C8A9F33|nr:tetraspanin-33 isoform X1 [Puntigrus tetrazona]